MPVKRSIYPSPARQPRNLWLDSAKLREEFSLLLPEWKADFDESVHEPSVPGACGPVADKRLPPGMPFAYRCAVLSHKIYCFHGDI